MNLELRKKRKLTPPLLKVVAVIAIIIFISMGASAAYGLKKDTFRVAYLEGDPYVNYTGHLYGLAKGLSARGLVEDVNSLAFKEGSDDARQIWNWLSTHGKRKLSFKKKDFYQLVYMTAEEKRRFVHHMNRDDSIDLIIVMGTAAGTFVKESGLDKEVMVMSVTDAKAAGIVKGNTYSGTRNIWAHTAPKRYYNQLKVFQNLFELQSMGIVYENSANGRKEISYNMIKQFTAEKGIKLTEIKVNASLKKDGQKAYEAKMIRGYNKLEGKVDGVYMTNCGGRTKSRIQDYVAPLYKKAIPVFSQTGKEDVEGGAMLAVERSSFNEIGDFCAKQFQQIMQGRSPGSLMQNYDEAQAISINMKAARQANIKIPFQVLLSADTIYTKTEYGEY